MTLKTLFTDKDDNLELASVLGVIAFLALLYFSYEAYVVLKQAFSPLEFGGGAAAVGGGTGAGKLLGSKADYGQ